ncbi:MAG: CDP-alcohol phosphatidyltransferase family protein [bacterium]|nr:CDP-alcohol phosphatidyltransferase family protein [bacterium]
MQRPRAWTRPPGCATRSEVSSSTKPWDSRIANALVRPLRDTAVTPNQLTSVGLCTGLAAAAAFAVGGGWAHVGAALFVLSALLDHADGELARMTGKTSPLGHVYDRVADLVVKVSVFAGMGFGMRHGLFGGWAGVLGLVAGISFVTIFLLRSELARRLGRSALDQPAAGPFEIEDILYLVAPVTWSGNLEPFVAAAAIGAPLFAIWTATRLAAARPVLGRETPSAWP